MVTLVFQEAKKQYAPLWVTILNAFTICAPWPSPLLLTQTFAMRSKLNLLLPFIPKGKRRWGKNPRCIVNCDCGVMTEVLYTPVGTTLLLSDSLCNAAGIHEQLILTRWRSTAVAAAHVPYAHSAFIQRLSQSGLELDWQLFQGASICYCVSWIHLHLLPQAAVAQAISDSRLSIKTLWHGS